MVDLILSNERMTFESKKQVFCHIISSNNIEFLREYPKLNKDLSDIISDRNILAHYFFDSSEESVEVVDKKINFIKYKNVEQIISFDNNRVLALKDKIGKYVQAIHSLLESL